MITDILGKTGATDAAASSKAMGKGRKGVEGPEKGFHDALSGLERDTTSRDVAEETEVEVSGEPAADSEPLDKRQKPIIDLKPQSLKRATTEAQQPQQQLRQHVASVAAAAAAAVENGTEAKAEEANPVKELKKALGAVERVTQPATRQEATSEPDAAVPAARTNKPAETRTANDLLPAKQIGKADLAAAQPVQQKAASRPLTTSEVKLRDALNAAKAVADKVDSLHQTGDTGAKKAAAGVSHEPHDVDDADVEADIAKLLGKSESDANVTDVLSLLGGNLPAVATAAVAVEQPVKNIFVKTEKAEKRASSERDVAVRVDGPAAKLADQVKHADLGTDQAAKSSKSTDEPVPERSFRLTGAKGETRDLEAALSARGQADRTEARSNGSGQVETVTVLESRRYLGLAPTSNAAVLTSALAGDPEWVGAAQPGSALTNAATQSSTGSVVNTLKLQMNPNDLGSVTAMLRLQGDELNVHLTVETRAAYKQLSEDSSGILDALRSQGLSIDQVTVSIAPSADTDTTRNQQQGGQQATANGERQDGAAGRSQDQSSGRQAGRQNLGNENDVVSYSSAAAPSGGARPDQLYL